MAVTRPRPTTGGVPVPGYPNLRYIGGAASKPAEQHVSGQLLAGLQSVAQKLKGVIIGIFSGSGGPAVRGAGFAGDPHDLGIAADASIDGVALGAYPGAVAAIHASGLRTGATDFTYQGKPDLAHVDTLRPRGSQQPAGSYDYMALVDLWVQSGGDQAVDETMAAIALAESSGDPHASNVNVDGSVDRGLWQVNSVNFDSPTLFNPRTNASWAIKIYKQQGLRAWTTYKTGAYRAYLQNGSQTSPDPSPSRTRPDGGGDGGGGGALSWLGAAAGGPFTLAEQGFSSLFGGGIGSIADVFKGAIWLMNPRSWLRMVEFVTGMVLMLLSLIGLAVMFIQRSPTVGKAAGIASALPGPAGVTGRAVTVVRAPAAAAARKTRATERAQRQRQQADELAGRRQARLDHETRLREARARSVRGAALARSSRRAPTGRGLS